MTTLTEREYNMLGLVLDKLAKSEGAVELDYATKKMKYVKKIEAPQTEATRRNHAKLALRLLGLKLAAMGITFGRVTTLGRSNKGQYDFDTKADRAAARKLYESMTFAKNVKK
jgi:hypothetical protein